MGASFNRISDELRVRRPTRLPPPAYLTTSVPSIPAWRCPGTEQKKV
jgi:hypothetical protein